jgi:cobalt-precorrin 5A hydrolase
MSGRFAIGVGCRKGCSADAVEALVRQALAGLTGPAPSGLFTLIYKNGEPGLIAAAERLGFVLHFLTRDALRAQAARVQTAAPQAQVQFGVPSVAEAAALAGAGPDAVLIVPRIAANGATCAIAGTP